MRFWICLVIEYWIFFTTLKRILFVTISMDFQSKVFSFYMIKLLTQ